MGPPQLGADEAPQGYVPDPAAALCRKCGQARDAHERVHPGTMTHRKCPEVDSGSAPRPDGC